MRMKWMNANPAYARYKIGRGTYGDPKVEDFGGYATLEVGSFTSFARGVTIFLSGEHRTRWCTTSPLGHYFGVGNVPSQNGAKGDVRIGSDCWIGFNATILSGVTIGHGAVVGACSVVTGPIPPYAIVAGNPLRFIRWRFDDKSMNIAAKRWPCVGEPLGIIAPEIVERLLAIAWWDRDDQWIKAYLPLLMSDRIEEFLEKAASDNA